ncbi:hypothetical protein M8C21_007987 [Ambrosia artemisiifolia]|uniref:non-specific serine/threonine protein kinase n=1 Tax=Ambrosia artemisiifolia TaxID=4212 RepID=A0AAD5GND4_AMBAR|nr:hypothetical protein M8C21_007987 [Ambrosia artemisiifolia]
MGNKSSTPNTGRNNNGFIQSVTAAVWTRRPPEPAAVTDDESTKGKNVRNENNVVNYNDNKPDDVESGSHEEKPKPKPKTKATGGFKRAQSMGMKDSVLQRKTENLKDVYSVGKKLGQGQFGTTFLCIEKETGKEFACKSIAKRKLTTKDDVEDVRREIQIMHHLAGHPNVISIVGAYEDAVAVHVVMELCAGGELFDRIIQRGHYTEKKAAELARIIVGGRLHYLSYIRVLVSLLRLTPSDGGRVIAENLSEEEIAGLKNMFRMIDTDGSGQITLEELTKGLEKVGANLQDSEIIHLMEAADIDNSGTIDYGEFLAAMLHVNKVNQEDHMYAAFSYFDKDGSGYITADELQSAFDKFGLGDIHLDEIMSDIDKDNDGRIDYGEFVAMMQDPDFGRNISVRLR